LPINEQEDIQLSSRKNPRFDTYTSDLLDETMQYLEIEEGAKRIQTIHNYYVIPEIKSLDFLNVKQNSYQRYFQSHQNDVFETGRA
jgi:hypothetical protein